MSSRPPVRRLVLLAFAASAVASPAAQPPAAVVFSGPTGKGTRYAVRVVMSPGDEPANRAVREAIARVLAEADALFPAVPPESPLWPMAREVSDRAGVALDVGALRGGLLADGLVAAVRALGHGDVLADAGEEVAALGRRADGARWRVAIDPADRRGAPGGVVELSNESVATARPRGDGGAIVSATVVDTSAALAAARAAALAALPPGQARAFAERERLAARIVARGEPPWSTQAFEAHLAR